MPRNKPSKKSPNKTYLIGKPSIKPQASPPNRFRKGFKNKSLIGEANFTMTVICAADGHRKA